MSRLSLTIVNLFPHHLNGYGDEGNLLVLHRRCKWRDLAVSIVNYELGGQRVLLEDADLIFGGDGHKSATLALWPEIERIAGSLRLLVRSGVPALAIGASFQLLGEYLETAGGGYYKGAAVFPLHTINGEDRKTGNIVTTTSDFGLLIGYENHRGRTFLHEGAESFAHVISGFGNNGTDGTEGARYLNALGTYLHGPLLPKNPQIADYLIARALEKRYGEPIELTPLPDTWVEQARNAARNRSR